MSHFGQIDQLLTLPIRYFGTVDYYATMGAYARVVVDDIARYDKRQKATHRMDIIDTHGVKSLTVPVSRPDNVVGPLRWSDIKISQHGQWWHVIAETLASAYGRTPFFEFYIDRLSRFFSTSTAEEFHDVATLCREVDTAVRAILSFDNEVIYASQLVSSDTVSPTLSQIAENTPHTSQIVATASTFAPWQVEYYQVRQDKFGFVPNLSILDLIFNMGPESPLLLRKML